MNNPMKLILAAALAGLLGLAGPALAGGIKGTVRVNGLRSPAGVLVYLAKAPDAPLNLSEASFALDQRNLTFIPSILPVPVGAAVNFPNNDQVNHNVFSLSSTKKFNLGSYGPGESKTVTFDQPGLVELRCDVHAEMLAFIAVMKNPYYALTDDAGGFVLPDREALAGAGLTGVSDLPPGRYLLRTWHPKLKSERAEVEVGGGGEAAAEFTLTRGAPGVLHK